MKINTIAILNNNSAFKDVEFMQEGSVVKLLTYPFGFHQQIIGHYKDKLPVLFLIINIQDEDSLFINLADESKHTIERIEKWDGIRKGWYLNRVIIKLANIGIDR